MPLVLTVVLIILAIVGAILLFSVVKPNRNASATGVAKAMIADFKSGKNADEWRCAQERKDRAGNAWLTMELGVTSRDITGYSATDEGKVRRVKDRKVGTDVRVTLRTSDGSKSVDLFVLEEHDKQRVCGIGSLTGGSGG